MQYFTVKQIFPWLYSIKEIDVFCYLIIGKDSAILFDAAYGIFDLREVVEDLTDKPYTVILGHGHLDHVNAAPQFDSVLLHEADMGVYDVHASVRYRKSVINRAKAEGHVFDDYDKEKYALMKQNCIKSLEAGMSFDLGGLTVDVINMEGHTAGSVGLLIREHSVLLTSDSACGHVWLFLRESLPLSEYIKMLERVSLLPFNSFFVGHSDEEMDKSVFYKYIQVAKNVDVSKAEHYAPFNDIHEVTGWFYQEDGIGIVFNDSKM